MKFCSKLHVQGYATSRAPPCKGVRDNYKSSRLGRLLGALWRARWIHAQSLASDSAMTIPTRSEGVAWKTGDFFRRDLPGWLRGWDTSSSPGALSRGGKLRFRFQGWCCCRAARRGGSDNCDLYCTVCSCSLAVLHCSCTAIDDVIVMLWAWACRVVPYRFACCNEININFV